jgi:O-antigen ligase
MRHLVPYFLPLAVALGLLALVEVDYFVVLLVLPTMVWPQTLASPGGTQIALSDLLMLVAVTGWLIANSVRAAPDPFLRRNPMLWPLITLIAVNAISVAWSTKPHATFIFVVQLIGIAFVTPIVFASLPRSIAVVRRGFNAYIAVSSGLAVAAIVVFIVNAAHGNPEGTYLPGIHKNALGSFLAAGMVLAFSFAMSGRQWGRPWVLGPAAVIEMLGLFASVSRGAIIGGLVSVVVASLLLRRRRVATAVVIAIAATGYLAAVGPVSAQRLDNAGAYDSSVVRNYSFSGAIRKIKNEPFLGSGAATYEQYIPELRIGVADPNNMFLLTWAEVGVVGMAALIWFLIRFGQLLWRARNLPGENATGAIACAAVTLSFFIHFQVDITWTRGTTTLAFAMLGLMLTFFRLAEARAPVLARSRPAPAPEQPLIHA